jgi:ketosteroid isomerase-like protein
MSRENVEIVRRVLDALQRRDFETASTYAHPDVEIYPALEGADTDPREIPYRGRNGMKAFLEAIYEPWQEMMVEVQETTVAPDERIVAVERWHTRGRDGIAIDTVLVDVYSFREGLVVRVEGFRDRAEALEAVGLSE